MGAFDDLTGQEFGTWKVIKFDHMKWNGTNFMHGMSYYLCECKKCGMTKLKARSDLKQAKNNTHFGCKEKANARIV